MKHHRFRTGYFEDRSHQTGLSLLELMVTVVLTTLFIGAATTAFIAHGRLHRGQSDLREAQENARTALSVVERNLRLAGYGIGSEFAFDFEHFECQADDAGDECPRRRDRTGGPDELVFNLRNPSYFTRPGDPTAAGGHSWVVDIGTSPGTLSLVPNGDDPIQVGQSILVLCPGGFSYAYVTVDAINGVENLTVGHTADDPFRQGSSLSAPCFRSGTARAFTVNRYRFFIGDDEGNEIAGEPPAAPGRPYLYLDRGIEGQTALLVAADIEDLQVAYIMRNGNVFGTSGARTTPSLAAPSAACAEQVLLPFYRQFAVSPCQLTSNARTSDFVANIVAVRVTVVARTPAPARDARNTLILDDNYAPDRFAFENRVRGTEPDGYKRVRLSTTVWLPNMSSTGIPLL